MKRIGVSALLLLCFACSHAVPRDGETLRLIIARHGQTDWNLQKRLQGQTDTELNATGRQQAEALAQLLHGMRIDHVYSSALKRSRETARIAANGQPVESLTTLNERAVGKFEGAWIDGRDPALEEEYRRRITAEDDDLDGGETRQQFFTRVCTAVNSLRADHSSGTILIVGHGGTNQMILRCLLRLTREETALIQQNNDELYEVELSPRHAPLLWKQIPGSRLGEL